MVSSITEMTDFEINCAVAASLGREFFYNSPGEPGRRRKSFVIDDRCRDVYESGAWSSDVFDPSKSWADAGPIIMKSLIGIKPVSLFVGGHRWLAFEGNDDKDFNLKAADNNPLRAAMIVFLMMQEQPNA